MNYNELEIRQTHTQTHRHGWPQYISRHLWLTRNVMTELMWHQPNTACHNSQQQKNKWYQKIAHYSMVLIVDVWHKSNVFLNSMEMR